MSEYAWLIPAGSYDGSMPESWDRCEKRSGLRIELRPSWRLEEHNWHGYYQGNQIWEMGVTEIKNTTPTQIRELFRIINKKYVFVQKQLQHTQIMI